MLHTQFYLKEKCTTPDHSSIARAFTFFTLHCPHPCPFQHLSFWFVNSFLAEIPNLFQRGCFEGSTHKLFLKIVGKYKYVRVKGSQGQPTGAGLTWWRSGLAPRCLSSDLSGWTPSWSCRAAWSALSRWRPTRGPRPRWRRSWPAVPRGRTRPGKPPPPTRTPTRENRDLETLYYIFLNIFRTFWITFLEDPEIFHLLETNPCLQS